MRRPDSFRSRDDGVDSMMTPMIDVVFLLLVFFVWTTSMQIIEYILPSQLSARLGNQPIENIEPTPEEDFDDIVIKIGWDGAQPSWQINDVPMTTMASIEQRLREIVQIKSDAPIILHPQSLVPMGYVIEAYDVAKLAGFQKISFAVNPQGGLP